MWWYTLTSNADSGEFRYITSGLARSNGSKYFQCISSNYCKIMFKIWEGQFHTDIKTMNFYSIPKSIRHHNLKNSSLVDCQHLDTFDLTTGNLNFDDDIFTVDSVNLNGNKLRFSVSQIDEHHFYAYCPTVIVSDLSSLKI